MIVMPDFPGLTAGATHYRPYGPAPSGLLKLCCPAGVNL